MTATNTWATYPLTVGTVTDLGTVERVSLTAYLVDGQWVGHDKVHGPRGWAEPLVQLS